MKDRNNLEQQLADKLGNRSITPSGQAWDRIVRNREQGKDKKKKKRTYIYYAASIVLLMLFGSYYFMLENNNDVKVKPQIVTTGAQNETFDVITPDAEPETGVLPKQMEIATSYEVERYTGSDIRKDEVATITGAYNEVEPAESPTLAGVTLQEKRVLTKEQLYEQEVDYLLKNAVKDVAADKILSKPTDNTALLKEVEGEMNEYYREKAMSIFSLKNKKIRFAVKD
ncbi:hypothetical protein ACX0HA_02170 [Flavobacterium hauense]